jgi:L-ascorbate metabolism protein UlaG (beta-lactamase superfamily)
MYHNYDGKRFYNLNHTKTTGKLKNFIKWQFNKKKSTWPDWVENEQADPIYEKIENSDLRVTFVNHATVLIQTQGLNILTDPVWSKRVSPIKWLGPKRIKNPGISFDLLPKIDLILLSHDHYDHLDIATLVKLNKKFAPKIFAGLKINNILKKSDKSFNCHEMGWWEGAKVIDGVNIHFVPAKHWSGRNGFYNLNSSLWGGFVVETPDGNIYFAGDTGYSDHFKLIQQRFDKFRLSLLPIGAYDPKWFLTEFHIDPNEAAIAHKELNSSYSMAIHYGTFKLSDEDYHQPGIDLNIALIKHDIKLENFRLISEGKAFDVPRL